ncbi:MAG: hypothetical protein R6X06_06445 [Gammaproteobacteria bacterium]
MKLFIATVLMLTSLSALAASPFADAPASMEAQPLFQLSYQDEAATQVRLVSQDAVAGEAKVADNGAGYFVGNLKRYDAAWLYPVSSSAGMNLNLGVNLRHFDGQLSVESGEGRVLQSYRSTVPMLYASALFDLPFKGLSARMDGGSKILNVEWDNLFTNFDYKAALRYDWENGLGLEGGWQQRQWQLDDVGRDDNRLESRGLFLDLKYQF